MWQEHQGSSTRNCRQWMVSFLPSTTYSAVNQSRKQFSGYAQHDPSKQEWQVLLISAPLLTWQAPLQHVSSLFLVHVGKDATGINWALLAHRDQRHDYQHHRGLCGDAESAACGALGQTPTPHPVLPLSDAHCGVCCSPLPADVLLAGHWLHDVPLVTFHGQPLPR
jgi:hypothetical protein